MDYGGYEANTLMHNKDLPRRKEPLTSTVRQDRLSEGPEPQYGGARLSR